MMLLHILEGSDGHGNVWIACDRRRSRRSDRLAVMGRALVLNGKHADSITCTRCRRAYQLSAPAPSEERETPK